MRFRDFAGVYLGVYIYLGVTPTLHTPAKCRVFSESLRALQSDSAGVYLPECLVK